MKSVLKRLRRVPVLQNRIIELDGLRGVAILLVIGCHYQAFATRLWQLPKFGWLGVDIFFVLSGYLITFILLGLRGRSDAMPKFYGRRFRRILPPLGMALFATAIACALTRDREFFAGRSILKNLMFLQSFGNLLPLLHGLMAHHFHTLSALMLPPATDGVVGGISASASLLWSLSIEEYFYLLWAPVVLWLGRKLIVTTAIGICVVEFFVRWICFTGRPDYFSIYYRFDALLYGALLALLLRRVSSKTLLAIVSVAVGALFILLYSIRPFVGLEIRNSPLFMVFGLPLISIAAASIVGLCVIHRGEVWLSPLRLSPLQAIGKISYMLYLIHILVYLSVLRFFSPSLPMAVFSFCCACLLSWASWKYIESPILYGRSKRPIKTAFGHGGPVELAGGSK
jgi:peptidoglycan/LPS O-acetylase OafA/YrhL